jgi:hypothetical protein
MSEPRPAGDRTIVRAAIYPAIGIARVGNRASEYFLAPTGRGAGLTVVEAVEGGWWYAALCSTAGGWCLFDRCRPAAGADRA